MLRNPHDLPCTKRAGGILKQMNYQMGLIIGEGCLHALIIFASSSDWLIVLFAFAVIARCRCHDYFVWVLSFETLSPSHGDSSSSSVSRCVPSAFILALLVDNQQQFGRLKQRLLAILPFSA